MTFESLMTMTGDSKCLGPNDSGVPWADDSEMPWAGCLKIQEIQSQNSDCLENTVSKIVLGQRSNPKLLEKPWAGGTLFF